MSTGTNPTTTSFTTTGVDPTAVLGTYHRAQREALRRLVFDHNIADFQKWFYAIFSKTPERIFEILMERDRGGKALSLSYSIFNVRPVIYSYAEYRLAKMSSDGGRVARRGAARRGVARRGGRKTDEFNRFVWNLENS